MLARQFPRQPQMRQSRRKIRQPVECLSYEVMQFPPAFRREQTLLLHLSQEVQPLP